MLTQIIFAFLDLFSPLRIAQPNYLLILIIVQLQITATNMNTLYRLQS